ncbi:MAG: bifunctional diaminohydroxyphosphoribosylaminopyrimidine deaminase/5-amino-6-(5-phosphoribosylamino)uracil reductase RibD [Pseudomonadales bacterium]|nr:bifunctional diaminohydroxyphosphoribosylaminopyrimidine deaminase/5-amino-6-(5-phosphoribosylamino)uracil reductase RibD [Pseudomonadales bacterium]
MKDSDRLFLEAAVALAGNGRFTCAPNPAVGCVIVRDGLIVGRGFHMRPGEGHAEVEAIRSVAGDVRGTTVYVSLEPCAFEGRTPACAKTLIAEQVERVVIAATDPHPRVSGEGIRLLREAGITVDVVVQPEALELIRGYRSRVEIGRPFVRIKSASSLDGGTALANGDSQWITSSAARADVQYWRARSDAIITGIGTVLADDPALTVRDHSAEAPVRVVLDRRLRIAPKAQILTDSYPSLIVHNADSEPSIEQAEGVMTEFLARDTSDLEGLLTELGDRGCNEVLLEAGAELVGSFVAQELWDEWVAYVAPAVMGGDARNLITSTFAEMPDVPRGKIVDVQPIGEDVRITMVPETQ